MSSPEQHLLSAISFVTSHTISAAEQIEYHVDTAAKSIRSVLSKQTWLPSSARPSPPPPPPPASPPGIFRKLGGMYFSTSNWIHKNKVLATCLLAAGCGGAAGLMYYARERRKYLTRKRRARKANNGARKEVIIIVGHPREPLTHIIALDLEKRGFIVYIVISSTEDEKYVLRDSRDDIKPLLVDVLDPAKAEETITQFTAFMLSPQTPLRDGKSHFLQLIGLLVIPNLSSYPTGPLEVLPPEIWSDSFNINILHRLITTKFFIRLLATFKARVVFFSSNLIPSISPPFHAIEAATGAAINSIALSLNRELFPLGISVHHFKLGNFDIPSTLLHPILRPSISVSSSTSSSAATSKQPSPSPPSSLGRNPINAARSDILSWPTHIRSSYAGRYIASTSASLNGSYPKGSPLKILYREIFDCLTEEKTPKRVWRVGHGSLVYELAGSWMPEWLTSWGMGLGFARSASARDEPQRRTIRGRITEGDEGSESGQEKDGSRSREGEREWEKVERLA